VQATGKIILFTLRIEVNQRNGPSSDGILLAGRGAEVACQPGKRKVGGSTPPLTTGSRPVDKAFDQGIFGLAPPSVGR